MNSLDTKIQELYAEVAYLEAWNSKKTMQNWVELRNCIDQGYNTRSAIIGLLKIVKGWN